MLGYRDSGMPGTPANQHPAAFMNAERVEATGHLVRIIRELRPTVIVTEPPGGLYAHPDHVMCYEVSVEAFQAAGDSKAFPEAGPPWRVAKLYAIAQVDDGCWRPYCPRSPRPVLTWPGWNDGHTVRVSQVPRRRRWRSMSALTVNTSARLCLPIALKSRQRAFWSALPPELRRLAFATA